MADLAYTTFEGVNQTALGPPQLMNVLSIGASAVNSGDLNPGKFAATVRVNTDTACWVMYGPAEEAIAQSNGMRMAANQTEYFQLQPGDRLSVIQI